MGGGLGFPHAFHPAVKLVTTPGESKCQRSLQEALKLFPAYQIRLWFLAIFWPNSGSQPEGLRRCGYKALQNPALLLFLSKNTQILLHILFYLHLRHLMKANYRAEQGSETIPIKKCWFSHSPASAGLLRITCRWDVCCLIFKTKNNIPGNCQWNYFPPSLSSTQQL